MDAQKQKSMLSNLRLLVKGSEDKVYLLKKALYGLEQAPKAWYSRIDNHLQQHGFKISLSESTLYLKIAENILVISLYVDDLLITRNNSKVK